MRRLWRLLVGAVFLLKSPSRAHASLFRKKLDLPPLENDLLLSQASFLMSHDAATGYLPPRQLISRATNLYAKNQLGNAAQQLQHGARALDLRPRFLNNGTVTFHHGSIPIPVTLEQLLRDVLEFATQHPDELILLFHFLPSMESSNLPDTPVNILSKIYQSMGIPYLSCSDIVGLTVGEAMSLAATTTNNGTTTAHVLALDPQDDYLSSCVKMNYVGDSIVTCYPKATQTNGDDDTAIATSSSIPPCTKPKISPTSQALQYYCMASANNAPTDSTFELGPPASLDTFPFFAIQALWQVDTHAAATGISHLSSLLDDNTKSHINAKVVDWVYQGIFHNISLLMVDHVQLNGNAILSVLRTQCGQSSLDVCGKDLSKPRLQHHKPFSTVTFWLSLVVYVGIAIWAVGWIRHYRNHYQHDAEVKRLQTDLKESILDPAGKTLCGVASSGEFT